MGQSRICRLILAALGSYCKTHVYDVAVIGAGPSGAATARRLSQLGARVVILEATAYDGPRFGETLAPEINPILRTLGVWDAFLAGSPVACPGIISLWGTEAPAERDFINNVHGSGWHVDRNSFDEMLSRSAGVAGAEVVLHARVRRCRRTNEVWQIELANCNEPDLRARYIVDATGRNGLRLTRRDRRIILDRLVAIFLRLRPTLDPDARTIVESTPHGWWYYAPLPQGVAVASFICDGDLYRHETFSIGGELARSQTLSKRATGAAVVSSQVVPVFSARRESFVGSGWASVGDAAMTFDPISGYGIVGALSAAVALAQAIEGGDLGEYASSLERRFAAYCQQRGAYYALERRWPNHRFWQRRQTGNTEKVYV